MSQNETEKPTNLTPKQVQALPYLVASDSFQRNAPHHRRAASVPMALPPPDIACPAGPNRTLRPAAVTKPKFLQPTWDHGNLKVSGRQRVEVRRQTLA